MADSSSQRKPVSPFIMMAVMWGLLFAVLFVQQRLNPASDADAAPTPVQTSSAEALSLAEEISQQTRAVKVEKAGEAPIWVLGEGVDLDQEIGSGDKVINGQLDVTIHSLTLLVLNSSTVDVTDWLYRFTYYLPEAEGSDDLREIVLLVGPESMVLDGTICTAGDGGEGFSQVVDLFAGQYDYYAGFSQEGV